MTTTVSMRNVYFLTNTCGAQISFEERKFAAALGNSREFKKLVSKLHPERICYITKQALLSFRSLLHNIQTEDQSTSSIEYTKDSVTCLCSLQTHSLNDRIF